MSFPRYENIAGAGWGRCERAGAGGVGPTQVGSGRANWLI